MIKTPVALNVLVLVLSLTAFYSFVGQMVPQKEVHPPQVTEIRADIGVEELVGLGRQIFEGRGTCTLCHTLGQTSGPLRFPDLQGIGSRAGNRVEGLDDVGYLAQSLYEPNAYVVEGFNPGMPAANGPPAELTDDEILAVVAYLQSLGGTPSVTMGTRLADGGAEAAPATAPPATPPPPAAALVAAASPGSGDPENGERLYNGTCFVCHGDRAQGNELLNAPKLAGQEHWYIVRQLRNFAAGLRGADPNDVFGSQMRPMAMTLQGDQDMEDLAAYLSSL